MARKKILAVLQRPYTERCAECEGTNTVEMDESGFMECLDCGHFWPEGDGQRVYLPVA